MSDTGDPIASRTRSRTAAARSATAEAAARQRAANAETERLRTQNARAARIRAAFPRSGPHDVVANFTDATRASIVASQITRITDNLETEIQRIRNAATNSIQQPLLNRSSSRTQRTRTRVQIVDARRIMDVNVRSLYNLSQDIYEYLNIDQMLYFARNSITENYYFRKLELAYGIPTIDKFNQICQNIIDNIPVNSDAGVNIDLLPYRYDIDYYSQIINFLEQINTQFALVSNKTEIKNTLINELMYSINNEKITVNNLITHLRGVIASIDPSQNNIIRAVNETLAKLITRRDDLNTITTPTITRHFEDEQFENIRIYTMVILQAAITLCKIFLLLIIKLYNIQHLEIDDQTSAYGVIILNMYDAIANFTYIMSTSSSDYEELRLLLTVQKTLYNEIKDSLLVFSRDRSIEIMINEYNIQQTPQFNIIYNTTSGRGRRDLHPLTVELLIEPLDIETILTGRRRRAVLASNIRSTISRYNQTNRRAAIELRQDAIRQRQQEREAARQAVRQAREARIEAERAARAAARAGRAARPGRVARPPRAARGARGTSSTGPAALTNIEDMFDVDPRADATFTRTFIDQADNMYKTGSTTLLNKLKDKYILYSKDFKTNADRKLLFNEFNIKFKTAFNNDEPTPRVDSIENYVGNSSASLFIRYYYNDGDMKFNDIGKYYVINYTLEKISDDTAVPIVQRYRKIRQAGIDAGGLRRDFITALTTELFEKKIFITREGTKKYYLNSFYVPDDEFCYITISKAGFDAASNPLFIKKFYKFIGQLLSFILVNDCGIEHNLSSYTLANFNNISRNHFDKYDYVYFMLNDFPEFATSILNLMSDPDNIEYVCIGFNDYYKLTDEDKDIDKDDIEKYLELVSEYMMTTTILRKDIDIPTGTNMDVLIEKSKKMHKYVCKGIPDVIKTYFNKLTLNAINSYLVTPTMSDEIINKLKINFRNSMNKKMRTLTGDLKNKYEKLTNLFISRVLTNPIANPNEDQQATFFKFIDKLLKFWSGSSFYKDAEEYKIQINGGLSSTHLPQSHTCFFLIDLPDYTTAANVSNDDDIAQLLYNKIENAISNVEGGIGFAGGNKKNKLKKLR